MIEIEGISKSYIIADQAIRAVFPCSLKIKQGEFVSIVGHSGSGKSTLLGMIGGLLRPDSWTVLIDGLSLWEQDEKELSRSRNEKLGFVYQFSSLVPTLTVRENVLLPSVFSSRKTTEDAMRLLDLVWLADKTGRYPAELSGGERQRVAIARAFINNPRVILADEPTGELDEETEAEIMAFFERFNRERNITMIMVTHSFELAMHAGRRLSMKQGRVVELF